MSEDEICPDCGKPVTEETRMSHLHNTLEGLDQVKGTCKICGEKHSLLELSSSHIHTPEEIEEWNAHQK